MDSVFFWLSKLAWLVIAPDSLLVLLVLLAWMLWLRGGTRWAGRLLGAVATILFVVAVFPVGEWVMYPLETRFAPNPKLPHKITGIIVLGGPESETRSAAWDQVELKDGAERFLAGMALARRHPEAKLIFTGGSGSMLYQQFKGAAVAQRLFAEQGIAASRIVLEQRSRNTYENAQFSKALLKPARGQNWVLVTSASHMPRSMGIFCKAGWPVLAYPVDHHAWRGNLLRLDLNFALHLNDLVLGANEWVGLAAYYLSGKTASLFPAQCFHE